jgi:site-specific DNA-methyltransferase (adenine-specific)
LEAGGVRPYYEHAGITIYHGDCRDLIPNGLWFGVDAIVTDPPYGVALDTSARWPWLNDHAPIAGDEEPFDPSWLLAFGGPLILWGANHYASRLPDSKGWLCWDKATRDGLDLRQAEIEFAWTNCVSRPRMLRHMWSGAFRASERGTRYHPAQKPVDLMGWCISLFPNDTERIPDPYMGAGPILVAAKALGRRAIGIEIEERYCEIAANRLSQEVLAFA